MLNVHFCYVKLYRVSRFSSPILLVFTLLVIILVTLLVFSFCRVQFRTKWNLKLNPHPPPKSVQGSWVTARESPLLRRHYGYKRCKCHKSFQKALESPWSVSSLQSHKRIGIHNSAKPAWLQQPAESLTSGLPWSLLRRKEISKIGDEIGVVWGELP